MPRFLLHEPHTLSSEQIRQTIRDLREVASLGASGFFSFANWLGDIIDPSDDLSTPHRPEQVSLKITPKQYINDVEIWTGRWHVGPVEQSYPLAAAHFVIASPSIVDKVAALETIKGQHPNWLDIKGPAGESALFTALWYKNIEVASWLVLNTDTDVYETISSEGYEFCLFDALVLNPPNCKIEQAVLLLENMIEKIQDINFCEDLYLLLSRYKDKKMFPSGPVVPASATLLRAATLYTNLRIQTIKTSFALCATPQERAHEVASDSWDVASENYDAVVAVEPSDISWGTEDIVQAEAEMQEGYEQDFDEELERARLVAKLGSPLGYVLVSSYTSSESEDDSWQPVSPPPTP